MPAAHMQAPPMPWTKRARVEQHDVSCEGEHQAREAEQREPGISVGLTPQRIASQPAGQRADERAGGVGGGEHSGGGLREVQLVGVVRQQRRHGGEEHGVHEHHRRDEPEQPAHPYDAT